MAVVSHTSLHAVARPNHIQNSALPDVRVWARERRGLGLLTGERAIYALALGWQVILTLQGYHIHNIDGANRFNVFHLAGECMERGLPVEDILQAITVQRVFTPYQVLDVVQQIAEQALRQKRAKHTKHSRRPETLYFFLAPCKQFFDGDVGAEEGEFLLKRLLGVFAYMARRSLPVMIVERGYDHAFYPKLQQLAGYHWARLENSEHDSGGFSYGTYAGSLFHAD